MRHCGVGCDEKCCSIAVVGGGGVGLRDGYHAAGTCHGHACANLVWAAADALMRWAFGMWAVLDTVVMPQLCLGKTGDYWLMLVPIGGLSDVRARHLGD